METLELVKVDAVAVVRLNRPPVNAVNGAMMRELRSCFDSLSQDREVAAVVLSATGERAFCGGIDLKELNAPVGPPQDLRGTPRPALGVAPDPVRHPRVPGPGDRRGGAHHHWRGVRTIGCCDLVIAGDQATFGLTEINVGLLGGASKALRLLGPSKARRMLFLGEMISAQELYRLGAIEEVVPAGQAEPRAL